MRPNRKEYRECTPLAGVATVCVGARSDDVLFLKKSNLDYLSPYVTGVPYQSEESVFSTNTYVIKTIHLNLKGRSARDTRKGDGGGGGGATRRGAQENSATTKEIKNKINYYRAAHSFLHLLEIDL